MTTRRFLAAVVLAALPLFTGTLDAPPPGPTTDTAPHVAERPSAPRALHAFGFDFGWRWAFACVYAGANPMVAYPIAA